MVRIALVALLLIGGVVLAVDPVIADGASARETSAGIVDIALRGAYFSAPASVQLAVRVEPNDANRTLWIEADGDRMYSASEIPLNGANEKRLHQVMFKSLVAGHYSLRAQVRSSTGVRGVATREIVVLGQGPP